MTDLQKGILTLISAAVTGQGAALPEGFSMAEAAATVRAHHIATLAYEGAIVCGVEKKTPEMQQLFGVYCRFLAQSEQQQTAINDLLAAFEAHGIDHMPLKGCLMKNRYRLPELRLMGDADILIRTAQYDAVRAIVTGLGYEEQTESDHEYIWNSRQLHLELHKRLIPSYNKDYFRFFGDGWQLAKKQSGCCYAMTQEDEFLYSFVHFAKHYRDGGIGLRHVTDLWVLLRTFPNLDEAYLQAQLDTLHLQEFYKNIRSLIANWFEGGKATEKTEYLTQFLFSSGSWGQSKTHQVSQSAKKGKLALAVNFLFPGKIPMQQRYPVLRKCPALLPLFWPVRWMTGLLLRRSNVRHQRDLLLTDAADIQTYEDSLRYVGLSFDFKE